MWCEVKEKNQANSSAFWLVVRRRSENECHHKLIIINARAIVINKIYFIKVQLKLQQSPRARPSAADLPLLPRVFIGLIQTVSQSKTRSRLTVT